MHEPSASRIVRRRLLGVCAAILASFLVAACGGGESGESDTATSSGQRNEQQQPSPESGEGATSGDAEDNGSETGAAVDDDPDGDGNGASGGACPDVVITPNSGDGLFEVEAEGMSCEEAVAALEEWGQAGYPGQGPEGFDCDDSIDDAGTAPTELRCVERGSGAVIEFSTGV